MFKIERDERRTLYLDIRYYQIAQFRSYVNTLHISVRLTISQR